MATAPFVEQQHLCVVLLGRVLQRVVAVGGAGGSTCTLRDNSGLAQHPQKSGGTMRRRAAASAREEDCGSCGRRAGSREPPCLQPD
jgi:hypothetical protein